jgi:hypothetical protein
MNVTKYKKQKIHEKHIIHEKTYIKTPENTKKKHRKY